MSRTKNLINIAYTYSSYSYTYTKVKNLLEDCGDYSLSLPNKLLLANYSKLLEDLQSEKPRNIKFNKQFVKNNYRFIALITRKTNKIIKKLYIEQSYYSYLTNQKKLDKNTYRYKARFKNLTNNLHKVKGYSLLCKYGFYNRVSNPSGCVLDHRVSIKFGKDNSINPEILGHLANCEFLLYKDNIKKSSNCSISYEKLLKEIIYFDDISMTTI